MDALPSCMLYLMWYNMNTMPCHAMPWTAVGPGNLSCQWPEGPCPCSYFSKQVELSSFHLFFDITVPAVVLRVAYRRICYISHSGGGGVGGADRYRSRQFILEVSTASELCPPRPSEVSAAASLKKFFNHAK